jgi:hypothetical protein
MKLQLIQIEAFDNLFSIEEKMIHSKAESLLLIDQTGSLIFQDKKQAKLFQRASVKTGKEFGVVTQNSNAVSTLIDVGINSFYDIDSAQRFPWGSRNNSIHPTRRTKKNQSAFLKVVEKESQVTPRVRGVSLFLGIASLCILAAIFVPSAEIKIKVPMENQTIQVPLQINRADQSFGTGYLVVTPTITEIEVFQTINTTEKIDVPVSKAKGTISFINLTNAVVNIPKGLILRSSVDEKKEYSTIGSGEIQAGAGSSLDIPVESVEAGGIGNAEVGEVTTILGPIGLRVSAINSDAIQGGSDLGKLSPTETDRNNLIQICMEELKRKSNQQIQSNLRQDEIFLPETLKITEILNKDFFPAENTPADELSLSLKAKVSSIIISRNKLVEKSGSYLDAFLPNKYFAVGDAAINNIEVDKVNQDGSIDTTMTVSRSIKMMINVDEIKAFSSGKHKKEVTQVLQQLYHQNASETIIIHPGWMQDLPRIPFRITITVEE